MLAQTDYLPWVTAVAYAVGLCDTDETCDVECAKYTDMVVHS